MFWSGVIASQGRASSSQASKPMPSDSAAIARSRTASSKWRLRRTRWPLLSTDTPLSDGGSGSGAANTGRGDSPDDVPGKIAAWTGRRRAGRTAPRARILLVYPWPSPWLVGELPVHLIGITGCGRGAEWTLTLP